jgi:hypothetical protein
MWTLWPPMWCCMAPHVDPIDRHLPYIVLLSNGCRELPLIFPPIRTKTARARNHRAPAGRKRVRDGPKNQPREPCLRQNTRLSVTHLPGGQYRWARVQTPCAPRQQQFRTSLSIEKNKNEALSRKPFTARRVKTRPRSHCSDYRLIDCGLRVPGMA